MTQFTINEQLPSLNDYINKLKSPKGQHVGAAFKAHVDSVVCSYIVGNKKRAIKEECKQPVIIHFEWHEKSKRRDLDNVYSAKKYILDAMQKCGVIENDNYRHIRGLYDSVVYGNKDYVIVSVMPYKKETYKELIKVLNGEIERVNGEKEKRN